MVLSRRGGRTPPEGAVYVGRPTKWGNPFPFDGHISRSRVIELYEQHLKKRPDLIAAAKLELRGRDLVCWCAPLPCHADVLLRIANEET
jgi:hypothetical protein